MQIYYALKDGEVHMVSKSEDVVMEHIATWSRWPEEAKAGWEVSSEEKELPFVKAKVIDPGEEHMHVIWICPYTSKEIVTDIESQESGCEVWFCENGEMALVSWGS
jgi:hypothetical protein